MTELQDILRLINWGAVFWLFVLVCMIVGMIYLNEWFYRYWRRRR